MCLRLGVDLRIFHILVEHDGVPVSASQLAKLTKAELLLIGTSASRHLNTKIKESAYITTGNIALVVRIMRVISLLGFALEVDEQSYKATPLSRAFTVPALEAGMKAW